MIAKPTSEQRTSERRVAQSVAVCAAIFACAVAAPTWAQTTIGTPATSGDQLLFFYDARTDRVPFLTVSNPSNAAVEIEVTFFPTSLAAALGSQSYALPAAGNVVIDPTSNDVAGGAARGNAGIAMVTPVIGGGSRRAVVPPEPLTGGFTLSNTALEAAFGENPLGRLAVGGSGNRAAAGATVDGSTVKYQRFTPSVLTIPVHFNPQSLGDPEQDGNRVVLAEFADRYGEPFSIAAASDSPSVVFLDSRGVRVAETTATVNGVLLTDLQELAGGDDVLERSGKVFFDVNPGTSNAFGLFAQSLGTFASGQRMPAVNLVPDGTEPPPPTPTPARTPSATSTPNGSPTPTRTPGGTPTPGGGATCSGGSATLTIRLSFDSSSVNDLSGVTAEVDYPEALSIPGLNSDASVVARVTNLTGITNGLFQVGDDDSRVSVGLVSLTTPIAAGDFAKVEFDCTTGAALPAPSAIPCTMVASDSLGLEVPATCSLQMTTP